MIEAPKPRLKEMQRQILDGILAFVPAHATTHGFVRGRSINTFAAPLVDRHVVLRMYLKDFFPSFSCARIQTFLRTLGYPEAVADLLGALCTTAPRDVWEAQRAARVSPDRPGTWAATNGPSCACSLKALEAERLLYSRRHLPQGAPSSPALANLCASE